MHNSCLLRTYKWSEYEMDVRVFQLRQKLALIDDRLDRALVNNPNFRHFFQSIKLLGLFHLDSPDLYVILYH